MNNFKKIIVIITKVAFAIALAYAVNYFTGVDQTIFLVIYVLVHLTMTDIWLSDVADDVKKLKTIQVAEFKTKLKDVIESVFNKTSETKEPESRKVPVKSVKKVVKKVAEKNATAKSKK